MKHRSNSKKVPEESRKEKRDDLIAENRSLRKQVKVLRKEVARLRNRDNELQDIREEYETEIEAAELERIRIEESHFRCPKCQSLKVSIVKNMKPGIDYYFCQVCPGRGPTK